MEVVDWCLSGAVTKDHLSDPPEVSIPHFVNLKIKRNYMLRKQ